MTIGFDLNDVVRDFSDNFLKVYIDNYNREYDLKDFEMWTNDMQIIFPFKSEESYKRFVYEEFSFELFGKCQTCGRDLSKVFSKWFYETLNTLEEDVDVVFFSPMEYGNSIGYTYFFISKLNLPVRTVLFPKDSTVMWDKMDVMVTADPAYLANKPDGKISVRINKDYNKNSECDYSYSSLSRFLSDDNTFKRIVENGKR